MCKSALLSAKQLVLRSVSLSALQLVQQSASHLDRDDAHDHLSVWQSVLALVHLWGPQSAQASELQSHTRPSPGICRSDSRCRICKLTRAHKEGTYHHNRHRSPSQP